jgi:hypothetical protein
MKTLVLIMLLALVPLGANAQTRFISSYENHRGMYLVLRADNTYQLQSLHPDEYNSMNVPLNGELSEEIFYAADGTIRYMNNPSMVVKPEDPIPPVTWSEGTYKECGDTIICTDKYLHRKLWLLKRQGGDILHILHQRGYQYKNDIRNRHKIFVSDVNKVETREASELLDKYPDFYMTRKWEVNTKGEKMSIELFDWKDEKKRQVLFREYNPPFPFRQ